MANQYRLRDYHKEHKQQTMITLPDKIADAQYYFFIKHIVPEGVEYSSTTVSKLDEQKVQDFLKSLNVNIIWKDVGYHSSEKSSNKQMYGILSIEELTPVKVFIHIHSYTDDKKYVSIVTIYYPTSLANDSGITDLIDTLRKIQSESCKYEFKVSTIVSDQSLYFADFDLIIPDTNIEINYGKSFTTVHESIVKKLTTEQSGIYIFEGPPGTGKTTYIKNLIKYVKRDFIFIQNSIIEQLDSPQLIKLLIQKPNAVLIFEDAEKAVLRRATDNQSFVSTILSLSDGFLGSVLNVSIIITYNAEVKDVDQAIFRKGRLKYTHRFDKLSIEDAQRKIDHDKIEGINVTQPMSLAEIYGAHDDNGYDNSNVKQIGFAK